MSKPAEGEIWAIGDRTFTIVSVRDLSVCCKSSDEPDALSFFKMDFFQEQAKRVPQ